MEIKELIDLLPKDYEKECYEKKAIRRKRTIKNPLDLLVLLLYYLYDDHSLVDVNRFAILINIGNISDTALIKRFIQCKDWIKWLLSEMLPNEIIHYKKPEDLEPYRIIAVDASDIVQKGAVKKTWHLHYGADLFSLTCNQFKLTEQSTGESLKNFEIKEKDLIIADRAYGTITSIGHCLKGGGDFIIRIKNKPFNMYDGQGKKILLSDWLKTLGSEAGEISIYIKSSDKKLVPLRICARKKTKEEITIEEKRLKRLESKKQTAYSDDTKFTHQFMFVAASLPALVSAEKVLGFYRLRWQVELIFKRYKSLPGLGNIPAKTKESSEVWLNGKMFLALLIEKYLGDIDFSPSWNIRTEPECVERDEIGVLFDLCNVTSR